jgi:hypothetical protein
MSEINSYTSIIDFFLAFLIPILKRTVVLTEEENFQIHKNNVFKILKSIENLTYFLKKSQIQKYVFKSRFIEMFIYCF